MAARRTVSSPYPRRAPLPVQGTLPEAPHPAAPDAASSRMRQSMARMAATLSALLLSAAAAASDGIPNPLPGTTSGDTERGRAIVANRQLGLCLLCHSGPIPEEPFQGNLAPDLAGAGERSSAAQLRQRIVDPARINPATIMPAYFKKDGLSQVAPQYRGKTILSAQQVEDVVAYLQTLRTPFALPPQGPQPAPAPATKEKP